MRDLGLADKRDHQPGKRADLILVRMNDLNMVPQRPGRCSGALRPATECGYGHRRRPHPQARGKLIAVDVEQIAAETPRLGDSHAAVAGWEAPPALRAS
jgi:hypothetical protein